MNTYHRIALYCFVALIFSLILLATASASCVAHWSLNNSGGLDDACTGDWNATNNGASSGSAGVFDEAYDFESTDSDYLNIGDLDLSSDFTICGWMNLESTGAGQVLMGKGDGADANTNYALMYSSSGGNFRVLIKSLVVASATTPSTGNWYHFCGSYNSTDNNTILFVNNTYENSAAITDVIPSNDLDARVGTFGTAGIWYMDGLIDDVWVLNHTATCGAGISADCVAGSEIYNLFHYGNLSGVPPPTNIGCAFSNLAPAGGSWSADSTPVFSATLTCYDDMADNCSLDMNGTTSGFNSSLSNASIFEITANSTKSDARYDWFFSCTNGSTTNSSATYVLYIDATAPVIGITLPLNTSYASPYTAVLNFNYTEANPSTCFYSLDAAANTTIGYVNGTALTSTAGGHHARLWCNDSAGGLGFAQVYFTIVGIPVPPIQPPECTADTVFWVTANEATGNLTISCPSTAQTTAVPAGAYLPYSVTGVWNNATRANFSTSGSHWQLDAYNLTGSSATVTAWYYWLGSNGMFVPYQGVVAKSTSSGSAFGALGVGTSNPGSLPIDVVCIVGDTEVEANFSLNNSGWYFMGCRVDGSQLTLWANETNVTITLPSAFYNYSFYNAGGHYAVLNLGDYVQGGFYSYLANGIVDEATLWDIALSDTQINNMLLYNNISGITIPANCSDGICGYILDCGNQTGLEGVNVLVTQNNATNDFVYNTTTNSAGFFSIGSILHYLTSSILISKKDYESISDTFVLTDDSPGKNLSTCLILLKQSIMRINTQWSLSSNLTGGTERLDTWSDWRPNMTTKKDTIISGVDIFIEDTVSKEGVADIGFSESNISTTCSFSTTPTAYYIVEKGGGFYYLQVEIGGTNYTNLYAFCEDGDYFDIYYRSAGIDAHGRLDFISYEMRVTNVNVLVDTLPTYSWAYAFGDFYYETGDNKNIPVENLSCEMRLEQTSGSNITAWETATISITGVTQASYNFTILSATPPTVIVHFICNATGFTNFERQIPVQVGTDAMTTAFCYLTDANGLKIDWNKVGAQVRHWCEFKSYKNSSLISMQVKAKETASSTERILKYSYDSSNTWFFATSLFNDDMEKGLHEWRVTLYNTPSGMKQPNITYYQFVKVYYTPPTKVSADYCDDSNCPRIMYRGTTYVCKVTTKFEAEYTKIIMGVKLNDSTSLISITPTDNFNPTTQIHETAITIPSVGEGVYGIKAPTKIQCYAELYIDQEHLIYGATPTQMMTQYKHEFESDVFGLQKFLNEFTQSDNPMETGVAKIAGIPGWFFSKIAVTDENGNLNPVLAIMYLIAFALIIALVIVFVNTRQHSGGQGGGGQHGRPPGYLRIGGKRY